MYPLLLRPLAHRDSGRVTVREHVFRSTHALTGADEYKWRRCRICKARVLDGWLYLHDTDCPEYHDDESQHPPPREW